MPRVTSEPTHLSLNRSNWDDRAPVHAAAPYYEWDRFIADPAHLSRVVEFDRPRLPALDGVEGVTCSATSAPTRSRSPGWAPG